MSHPCNSGGCQHLTWITQSVCLSGSSLDYFFIWGQRRTTCPLPVCLCRSWLQMCLCRGSLDLRRAVVGVLVRTALEVASSRTLRGVASLHSVFRSRLYIFPSGMTWTQCQILVCGQFCPTLTCRISSVEHVCAAPKGNMKTVWNVSLSAIRFVVQTTCFFIKCNVCLWYKSYFSTKTMTWHVLFVTSVWREECFSLYLQ